MNAHPSRRREAPSHPPAAVLVVDDVEDNRDVLAARLAALGHLDVTMAVDGRQALEQIARRPFDLVLLDLMMPGISGIQVLEILHEQGQLEALPVIMVSAYSEMAQVVRCIELGAEDYLTKPINPTLLRARIDAILEKKHLRDALHKKLVQMDHELLAARELQLGMVPPDFIAPDGSVAVHLLLEPARQVGGDLCDCFYARDNTLWFAIGDVSGKGAAAAIFMARTWSCLHSIALREHDASGAPGAVLSAMNRELCEANANSMFTTLFLGHLDCGSGSLAYANAGHLSPYLLGRQGIIREFDDPPHPPVGAWPDTDYVTRELQLEAGDALFAYSDGLTEAMGSDRIQWGDDRLRASLGSARRAADATLLSSLLEEVRAFTGDEPQTDDISALILRWKY